MHPDAMKGGTGEGRNRPRVASSVDEGAIVLEGHWAPNSYGRKLHNLRMLKYTFYEIALSVNSIGSSWPFNLYNADVLWDHTFPAKI